MWVTVQYELPLIDRLRHHDAGMLPLEQVNGFRRIRLVTMAWLRQTQQNVAIEENLHQRSR